MKAFIVDSYGTDGLRAAEVPQPTVGRRDVLVEVRAASINPLDKMVRNGEFKRLLKYGLRSSSVTTSPVSSPRSATECPCLHGRRRGLLPGPATCASAPSPSSSRSTRTTSHSSPRSLSFEEAGAVPLVALAAWQALVDLAHVAARAEGARPRRRGRAAARRSCRSPSISAPTWPLPHAPATPTRSAPWAPTRSSTSRRTGLRRGALRIRRRARLTRRHQPGEVPDGPAGGAGSPSASSARPTPPSPPSSDSRSWPR